MIPSILFWIAILCLRASDEESFNRYVSLFLVSLYWEQEIVREIFCNSNKVKNIEVLRIN